MEYLWRIGQYGELKEDRIEAKDLNTLAKRSRDSEIINEAVGNIEAFGSNWIPTEDSEPIFVQTAKRRKVFAISERSEAGEITNSEVIPAKIRLALNDHTEYLREYEKVKSVPILKSFKKELGEKCCVKTCLSREGVDDVEFFPFSLDGAKNWKRSAAWMFAIDRKKLLTTAKICGYHFKDGVCLHSTHPQFNQNRNILRIDSKTELIKDDHESEGAKCGYIIFQGLNEKPLVFGETASTNKTGNIKKDSCSVVGCWFTSAKLCEISCKLFVIVSIDSKSNPLWYGTGSKLSMFFHS